MSESEDLIRSALTVIAADGEIGAQERRLLEALRKKLGETQEVVDACLADAKQGKLRIRVPRDGKGRKRLLGVLIQAATIDGEVAPQERRMLDAVANKIGASPEQLDGLIQRRLEKVSSRLSQESEQTVAGSHDLGSADADQGRAASDPVSPGPTQTWEVGSVIDDRYEVKGSAHGGMGIVYFAHDREWECDLAVKTILPDALKDEKQDEIERKIGKLVDECLAWVELGSHPNVIAAHFVKPYDERPHIFLEYADAGDLATWMADGRMGNINVALDIAIQLAHGLAYVHKRGMVHRDLKPANVLLASDAGGDMNQGREASQRGHDREQGLHRVPGSENDAGADMATGSAIAKITDFGLVKQALAETVESTEEQTDFTPGASIPPTKQFSGGTCEYASPEQFPVLFHEAYGQNPGLTAAADAYAFGLIMFELFAGRRAFAPELPNNVRTREQYVEWRRDTYGRLQVLEEAPRLEHMSDRLADLVASLLVKNPAARQADMAAVVEELKAVYAEVTSEEYPRWLGEEVEHLADGLNNKAVSLWHLGQRDRAEQTWEEALAADHVHAEATYNRGMLLWRSARITDQALVTQLEEVRATQATDPTASYLLSLLHLDRMDVKGAREALEEAARPGAGVAAEAALAQGRREARGDLCCLRTLGGRRASVHSVCLSADGRYALSGDWDSTLRLWDVDTGECLRTFEGHTERVNSVCFSADGRYALSGSKDKTLRLWDAGTGECLRTFEAHTSSVNSVCLSADGRYALSGSDDQTLRLWDMRTGECLRTFEGHMMSVYCVCLSADGRYVLSGGWDKTLRLWAVGTGECLRTFEGHRRHVNSVCLSADGRYALSGSDDQTLRLWDVGAGECLRTFEGHTDGVNSVCLSADGRYALSGSSDSTLRLWDMRTGECLRTFEGHMMSVHSVCLSADGRYALSVGTDTTPRLWDVVALSSGMAPDRTFRLVVSRVSSGGEAARTRREFFAHLAKGRQAEEAGTWTEALLSVGRARDLAARRRSPEALDLLASIGKRCLRKGLDAAWHTRAFDGHTQLVDSVCVSADGRYALSGSWDKTLRLWDVGTGECLRIFEGHMMSVYSVCLSVDGRYALSGSKDKTLRLWDVGTGECLGIFEGHRGRVKSVCLTADGRYALSGSSDWTLRLWDMRTGECLRIFERHRGQVNSICLSADGRHVLSGSEDGTLRLWALGTGDCLRTFEGHRMYVCSVCLSAEGRYVLSGGWDKTLRLWDVGTGECLRTFEGHTDKVDSVCLSADGRYALSGSSDGTLRLWELVWDYEAREPTDWDDGARPYLAVFLSAHAPYAGALPADRKPTEEEIRLALTRQGEPVWNEDDFNKLLDTLGYAGYGWLRPEGVRKKLEEMAAEWEGPPALGGET